MDKILNQKEVSFKYLEECFFKYACKEAVAQLVELLKSIDKKLQEERDKSIYRHKGTKTTTIKTIMGEVTFNRNIYQVNDESSRKKFVYLLDEYLKMETIGLISMNLAEQIVDNVSKCSYNATAKNISNLTGQSISHQGAWNVVQKLGIKVKERENEQIRRYEHGENKGNIEANVLFEESDGVFINIQGKDRKLSKTREMKVAISHIGWKNTGTKRYELANKNVVVGFDKTEKFAQRKEAQIADIYDVDSIKHRVFNSDGATWLRKLHLCDTVFQLDRFHVKQAINRAIKSKTIAKEITDFYETQQFENMFSHIEAYINSVENAEAAKKLYNYLKKNEDGLTPYLKQNINFPLAPYGLDYRNMGAAEHNVDIVIARRMKHRGASFSITGAENLGKLLALGVSKKLSSTLEDISKITLPESFCDDILCVLSAAKVPERIGGKTTLKPTSRPFAGASRTNGRKIIDKIFDLKEVGELKFI